MKILFLFLDGIGLGDDDPEKNPFARANMPYLQSLLGGQTLIRTSAPYEGEHATLLAVDPNLGIKACRNPQRGKVFCSPESTSPPNLATTTDQNQTPKLPNILMEKQFLQKQ
ncbi:MAG: hypothetical protein IPN58_16705 [Anaerolineales bacterium]|nr:hypothetical protein [Anaerolineales bacterium]